MIAWWKRRRERAVLRAKIEPWWSRWAVTGAGLAIIVCAALDKQPFASIAACVFFMLCAFHFLLILLRKFRYQLIELFVAALLGGSVNGLVLSMPGLLASPWVAIGMAFAVAAWVLSGLVKGLAYAEVFDCESNRARMSFIAAAWVISAGPALLAVAAMLFLLGEKSIHITPNIRAWFIPLGVLGFAALALNVVLGLKLRKKAVQIISDYE